MSTLTLQDYVIAGYPAIHYKTSEEWRALEECYNIARRTRSVFKCWSETKGFHTPNEKGEANHLTPDAVLDEGLKLSTSDEAVILCLLDFHPYMKNPRVIRKARDVFVEAKSKNITYIFVSAEFDIPCELKHEIFVFDMELPTLDEYKKCIRDVIEFNNFRNITEEEIEKASNALTGLTFDEAEKAISISLSSDGKIDLEILYGIKKQIINEDNLLEYYKAEETLENVGGLENFKNYARERSFSAFSEEAKEYGLPYPKGVLLFGVPGCGKSLVAKALSNMFHVPLIKFDLGKLFGSYVGETEKNTRKALKIAESTIYITGAQETSDYGVDLYGKRSFDMLLQKIVTKYPNCNYVIGWFHPAGLTEKVISIIARSPNIVEIMLHIQHVDEEILKKMNRPSFKEADMKIQKLKELRPDLRISTEVIVGFPGETKANFNSLVEYLNKGYFSDIGVASFESILGTRASLLPDQILEETKNSRMSFIRDNFHATAYPSDEDSSGSIIEKYYKAYEMIVKMPKNILKDRQKINLIAGVDTRAKFEDFETHISDVFERITNSRTEFEFQKNLKYVLEKYTFEARIFFLSMIEISEAKDLIKQRARMMLLQRESE